MIEVIVSVALLGIVGVIFLQGAMASSRARVLADERSSAKILAQSILDTIKKAPYSANYTATVPAEYPNYTAELVAESLESNDIQKITITILHHDQEILTLENYKVDR